MSPPQHVVVEGHADAVTLYVHGALTRARTTHVADAIRELPARVRSMRLDMRAVDAFDHDAVEALLDLIDAWRDSRTGTTRIMPIFPRAALRAAPAETWTTPMLRGPLTPIRRRDALVARR